MQLADSSECRWPCPGTPAVSLRTAKAGLEVTGSLSDLMEEPIVGSKVAIIDSEAPVNGMKCRRPL